MVRVRIAPSPTGFLHIGTARTALFNFLFAKHTGGKFLLRIEDTDPERSTAEFERDILKGLQWLGLQWDEELLHQSQRVQAHKEALQKLLGEQKAYLCYCTPEELDADRAEASKQKVAYRYNGQCRTNPPNGRSQAVVRLKLPEQVSGSMEWNDLIRGVVSVRLDTLDDFIIARSIESPLYNFAVVVDDAFMNITHVLRGEDHISNTPKQILIAQALGYTLPVFGHIPLILNADRTKMSKRKNEVSLTRYIQKGYLLEAMVNFLALLGWNPGTDQEFFTLDELVHAFDLDRVQKSGAIFNEEKLRWFNQQYLSKRSTEEFQELVGLYLPSLHLEVNVSKAVAVVRPRITVLSEIRDHLTPFTQELPNAYESMLLLWPKALEHASQEEVKKNTITILKGLIELLNAQEQWEEHVLEQQIKHWIADHSFGVGDTLWPLRISLSGLKDSPNPFELLEICGKSLSLKRIQYAIQLL